MAQFLFISPTEIKQSTVVGGRSGRRQVCVCNFRRNEYYNTPVIRAGTLRRNTSRRRRRII